MNHHQMIRWGFAITFVLSLLSACGEAPPTPIIIPEPPTAAPAPPPVPQQVIVRRPTAIPTKANTGPFPANSTPTAEETLTAAPSPTLGAPIDRPFLMRIDRISVIVGRGTLLQGRVANGTLQANSAVEILGLQNKAISSAVVAILIANTPRNQVKVGDYASILVRGVTPANVSPGMLLAAAGEYKSYQEALQQMH